MSPRSPSLTLQVYMCTGVPKLEFRSSCSGHAHLLERSPLSHHPPLPGSLPSSLATLQGVVSLSEQTEPATSPCSGWGVASASSLRCGPGSQRPYVIYSDVLGGQPVPQTCAAQPGVTHQLLASPHTTFTQAPPTAIITTPGPQQAWAGGRGKGHSKRHEH